MKKILFINTLLIVAILLFASQSVTAQVGKNVVEIKSKDVVKTRNVNPYIKITAPTEDVLAEPAPSAKGGEKKNTEIETTVDNYTGMFVEVYIDGVYKGTVSPWGTLIFSLSNPYKQIYCISTGGSKDWLNKGEYKGAMNWVLK